MPYLYIPMCPPVGDRHSGNERRVLSEQVKPDRLTSAVFMKKFIVCELALSTLDLNKDSLHIQTQKPAIATGNTNHPNIDIEQLPKLL